MRLFADVVQFFALWQLVRSSAVDAGLTDSEQTSLTVNEAQQAIVTYATAQNPWLAQELSRLHEGLTPARSHQDVLVRVGKAFFCDGACRFQFNGQLSNPSHS
jgi:hypothetical protein